MSDHVTSEKIVGTHTVLGMVVQVQRSTWRDDPGLSYDLLDAAGEVITEDESWDEYPDAGQMEDVVREYQAREAAREAARLDARSVWDAIQRGELPEDPRLAASDFYDLLAEYNQRHP